MQEALEVNIIQKRSQVNSAIIKQKGVKAECQGMFTAVLGQAALQSAAGSMYCHTISSMVPRHDR